MVVSLFDTKYINPKVLLFEFSSHCDGVLEYRRKAVITETLQSFVKVPFCGTGSFLLLKA